jgi:hypothetical protein
MNGKLQTTYLYLSVSYLIVPVLILLSVATKGEILPYFPVAPSQTWNIQYIPMVVAALVGILLAFRGRKFSQLNKTSVGAIILNTLWFLVFSYKVVTLWGDKV